MRELYELQNLFDYCPEDGDGIFNEFKKNVDDSGMLFPLILSFIHPIEINVALIGHSGVGKTSFLKRLTKGTYDGSYRATTDFYMSHEYEIQFDYLTKFKFYDFSSVERYVVYSNYDSEYVKFDIIGLMIDKSRTSYRIGTSWYRYLKKKFPYSRGIIIKNKIDIRNKDENESVKGDVKISVKLNIGLDNVLEKMKSRM